MAPLLAPDSLGARGNMSAEQEGRRQPQRVSRAGSSAEDLQEMNALVEELTTKQERIWRFFSRWVLTLMVVFMFHPQISLPSWHFILMWLVIWVGKGVMDVVEDCLSVHQAVVTQSLLPWALLCLIPTLWLPSQDPIFVVLFSGLVLGSLVAGGIDTRNWAAVAVITMTGIAAGFYQWLPTFSIEDSYAMVTGIAIHSLVDGLQDRVVDSGLNVPRPFGLLLKLKVLPLIGTSVVVYWHGSLLALRCYAFVLATPRFVVYDAGKIIFTRALLGAFYPTWKPVQGASPFSAHVRRFLLRLCVTITGSSKCIFIDELPQGEQALFHSPHKGAGMERCVALRAWYPIIPVESVDGPQWRRMRAAVSRILRGLAEDKPLNRYHLYG